MVGSARKSFGSFTFHRLWSLTAELRPLHTNKCATAHDQNSSTAKWQLGQPERWSAVGVCYRWINLAERQVGESLFWAPPSGSNYKVSPPQLTMQSKSTQLCLLEAWWQILSQSVCVVGCFSYELRGNGRVSQLKLIATLATRWRHYHASTNLATWWQYLHQLQTWRLAWRGLVPKVLAINVKIIFEPLLQ